MTVRTALLTSVMPIAYVDGYSATPADVAQMKEFAARNNASTQDAMLKRSKDSAAMLEYWDLSDTIVDGINAMRLAGDTYLPKFAEEEQAAYNYRLRCTKLTNIYRDTVEGLAAKPFEKEVDITGDGKATVPQGMLDFIEDVDGSGNNLTVFASSTFFNGINSAIDWIFVDFDKPDPTVRTVADAKARGLRPYWSHVLGRNVLDVRSKVIGGAETLTYIKIFEPGEPDRVRIIERLPTGAIVWNLYEKGNTSMPWENGETQFALIDTGTFGIGQIPLVPFSTGRRDGRSFRFFPAMRDAADLQVELYQQESGLKFAKTLAAYPMLTGNGVTPPKDATGQPKKLHVGPGVVLYAPVSSNGHVGSWAYVEPSAQSLKFLADDIKETQQQLRELARQPLTAQSGNITVINSAVAAGKAKSAVSAWAYALKDALENAMVMTAKFKALTYDPVVSVFTEFDEFLDGKDLETLMAMRYPTGEGQTPAISMETLWSEVKRRGVLGPEFEGEAERKRLLAELPGGGVDSDIYRDPAPEPTPTPTPTDPTKDVIP